MNISIIKSMCFRNNDDQMRFGKIFGYFVVKISSTVKAIYSETLH